MTFVRISPISAGICSLFAAGMTVDGLGRIAESITLGHFTGHPPLQSRAGGIVGRIGRCDGAGGRRM